MRGQIALVVCLSAILPPLPTIADTKCMSVVDDLKYCSDAEVGADFISKTIYPNLVRNYTMQEDPLIVSHIIVFPAVPPVTSGELMLEAVLAEMRRGQPVYTTLDNLIYDTSKPGQRAYVEMEYIGQRGFGENTEPAGAELATAFTYNSSVVLVITGRDGNGISEISSEIRAAHEKSVQSLKAVNQ